MTTAVAVKNGNGHLDPAIMESLVIGGDLSGLNNKQRIDYYGYRCQQAGLDPSAKPFDLLKLNGKLVLYANAGCTQQLCQIHGLSPTITDRALVNGIYCVTSRVTGDGRTTENLGAVPVEGLKGDALANAMMKAVTKAHRRTVLMHCGLGMLDETEVETIPNAQPQGRGNPLRHEFAALSWELDACKSQEQIDLLLESPEFKDFEARDNQSSGMSFAGMMRDKADQMKRKLPERIRYEGNKIVAATNAEAAIMNAGASSPDAAPAQSAVVPPRSNSAEPEPSPVEEIPPEYSELVNGFFDRIDLAESEAELKEISGAIVAKQTELSEQDKKALSTAWKQRKKTIAAKADA